MSRAGDLRNITATGTASEDNYVLTYDDATKKVSLEAASSGNTFSSDITAKTSVNTSSFYYRGAILNLQTDHTTVQVQDTLGAINFSAPDESSGGYASQTAGSITVKPEDNFTSSSNRSEMVFALGSAVNGIRDVMSLSTVNGKAAVQGLAPSLEIQNNDTSSQGYEHVIGTLAWNVTGATGGGTQLGVCAEIEAIAANGFSTSDNDTDLIFKTSNSGNPVERFRVTHDGHIKVKGDILHDGELDIKANNGDVDIDSVGGNVKLAGDTGNMEFTNTYNNVAFIMKGTGGDSYLKLYTDSASQGYRGLTIGSSSENDWFIERAASNNDLRFYFNPSTRMKITSNGVIEGASDSEIKTSPIRIHSNTISTNTTVASSENAVSGGPVTIANGVTVTVSGDWTVV